MNPRERLLSALRGLETLFSRPDIAGETRAYLAGVREAVERDPAEAKRVLGWFGGMGSFNDNEYLDLERLAGDGDDRLAAWTGALEEYHAWTIERCRLTLEAARALRELGYASPHLDADPPLLERALARPFSPPDGRTVARLELELRLKELRARGFARLRRSLLESRLGGKDWEEFAGSWGNLEIDRYMADQGRYRRRRHAVYTVTGPGAIKREKRQPHYQSVEYNPIHGGIDRWLDPIEGEPPALAAVLGFCAEVFGLGPWRAEVHQFRIEARPGEPGKPTPEGMHRDGVDFVLVLLVRRVNIESGTTTIEDAATGKQSSFTLTEPFDAVLVDDTRVRHGVTPVRAVDEGKPAYRDVLVVTFKRA